MNFGPNHKKTRNALLGILKKQEPFSLTLVDLVENIFATTARHQVPGNKISSSERKLPELIKPGDKRGLVDEIEQVFSRRP